MPSLPLYFSSIIPGEVPKAVATKKNHSANDTTLTAKKADDIDRYFKVVDLDKNFDKFDRGDQPRLKNRQWKNIQNLVGAQNGSTEQNKVNHYFMVDHLDKNFGRFNRRDKPHLKDWQWENIQNLIAAQNGSAEQEVTSSSTQDGCIIQ